MKLNQQTLKDALSLTSLSLVAAASLTSTIWLASKHISAEGLPLTPPITSPITPPSTPTPTTVPTPYPSPTPTSTPTPQPVKQYPIKVSAKPVTTTLGTLTTLKVKISQYGQHNFQANFVALPTTQAVESGCIHQNAGMYTLATCKVRFIPTQSGEFQIPVYVTNELGQTKRASISLSVTGKQLHSVSGFGRIFNPDYQSDSTR